ncbi:hypothetical protein CFIO01_02242 [Colletotrichum fioriniae PJ7]|uniref:Uncharacterized protein n=1 Tax=Colletotrichum fioriniae PJ7 TaxID=1445577 RepID=A0A010SMN7_9PEZI|nr:hypothetical protein CFIO01_02242 [Colletotrichum fioriniae PJ7]
MSSSPFALSHFRIFALMGKKRVSAIGEMGKFQRLIEVALGDFTRRLLSGQTSHRSPEPGSACGSEQSPTKTAVQTDTSGPGEWVLEGPPLIRTPGGWSARAYRLGFPHPAPRHVLPPHFLVASPLLVSFSFASLSKTNDSSMVPRA